MESEPVQACTAALRQAGWHVAPAASPWDVVTELHADRWWSAQLVDTAVLAVPTGLGVLQRVRITLPASGAGPPQHQVVVTSGPQPLNELPALVTNWAPPPDTTEQYPDSHHE